MIAETDSQGNITKRYIYGVGIDEPLSLVVSNSVGSSQYYYLQDALNNVVGLADKDGRLIESYTYDPFGKVSLFNHLTNQPFNQSSVGNNYLFAGREYDSESGLYYFRYRYYDPSLGRFINPEPELDVFLPNLYTYVDNNPVNQQDPLGLYTGSTGGVAPGLPIGKITFRDIWGALKKVSPLDWPPEGWDKMPWWKKLVKLVDKFLLPPLWKIRF